MIAALGIVCAVSAFAGGWLFTNGLFKVNKSLAWGFILLACSFAALDLVKEAGR